MIALRLLGIPAVSKFHSEINPKVRLMHDILHPEAAGRVDETVAPKKVARGPVDLYVAGPPCQSFSSMGTGQGETDPRGQVFQHVLEYIKEHRPRACVLENVRALAGKFKKTLGHIMQTLQKCGYLVTWEVLSTHQHGVSQSRPRLYIVAIQPAHLVRAFRFPKPLKVTPSVRKFLDAASVQKEKFMLRTLTRQRNFEHAKAKLKQAKVSLDSPVVIDLQASKDFANFRVDLSPCITATRCSQGAYYVTSLGRCMTLVEMGRLQGFPSWISERLASHCNKKGMRSHEKHIGHAIGNAMSVNVLCRLLLRVVSATAKEDLTDQDRWKQLRQHDDNLPDSLFRDKEDDFASVWRTFDNIARPAKRKFQA